MPELAPNKKTYRPHVLPGYHYFGEFCKDFGGDLCGKHTFPPKPWQVFELSLLRWGECLKGGKLPFR